MTKRDIAYLFIIVTIISIGLFGLFYYKNLLSDAKNKNLSLSNKNSEIINELKNTEDELENTKDELAQFKSRQKDTYLVYTMLKRSYFKSMLSNSSLISLAVLLNDSNICNDMTGTDNKLCNDIFDSKCIEYKYPNREICARLNAMLKREVSSDELILHCSNKDLIEDDLSQNHCFQYFAKATNNITLCEEICQTPINNTNCRAFCRDDNNELLPCKELYVKECIDYVLSEK